MLVVVVVMPLSFVVPPAVLVVTATVTACPRPVVVVI
jgi:hypothetical protein